MIRFSLAHLGSKRASQSFRGGYLVLATGFVGLIYGVSAEPAASSVAPSDAITPADSGAYYHGMLPEVTIASGGNQRGDPGEVLKEPVVVKVGGGLYNAPVTFAVSAGGALLTATQSGDEKPANSVDVRAVVPIPGNAKDFVAQVYVHLPTKVGDESIITATVRSGEKTMSASTPATAVNPALRTPTDLKVVANTATSVDLRWTPTDFTCPTVVEISADKGATWKVAETFPAGQTTGTVRHMRPDRVYNFRVYTGGRAETK